MNQNYVVMSFFMLELPNCFKERLALYVADGSADFDNGNFRILSGGVSVKTALDLIRDVRDYLNGSAAEISAPFFLKN